MRTHLGAYSIIYFPLYYAAVLFYILKVNNLEVARPFPFQNEAFKGWPHCATNLKDLSFFQDAIYYSALQ